MLSTLPLPLFGRGGHALQHVAQSTDVLLRLLKVVLGLTVGGRNRREAGKHVSKLAEVLSALLDVVLGRLGPGAVRNLSGRPGPRLTLLRRVTPRTLG